MTFGLLSLSVVLGGMLLGTSWAPMSRWFMSMVLLTRLLCSRCSRDGFLNVLRSGGTSMSISLARVFAGVNGT